ncbi:ATP-binding cassette domain-containing protein [Nocardioides sp. B-3]|nr:ATP-binding cassette domain-containing protein [Nocardioides sp. B-3]UUZ61198.1 ATP-binding cassette domain-containing protein [Nocardioides sp. B-3]
MPGKTSPSPCGPAGVDPREADEEAEAALGRFGIADLGDRQVEELSGGQMQRVACARGFVVGAGILLADEPTSELDEGNRGVVLAELREEAARGAVVVVGHPRPGGRGRLRRALRARRRSAGLCWIGWGMTRALRGAWSRRGALLTLLAMTAVVVSGAVAVLSFARAAGTSARLMSPLLLLGAVAIPSIGRELASARREEIGLARLRGIRGIRLGSVLLAEPLVTIVLGTVLGFFVGRLVARVAGGAWLDADVPALGSTAAYVGLGTAAASLLIVLVGTGRR